jgi:hypothetical protein
MPYEKLVAWRAAHVLALASIGSPTAFPRVNATA